MDIELLTVKQSDRTQFIQDLQNSFKVAVIEEYGEQESDVISKTDIEQSLHAKGAEAYHIVLDNKVEGGVVVVINETTQRNFLDLLFLRQSLHSKGIGLSVWKMIERKYPNTKVWETVTPYFEKRNIHFYVNKCGFKIVEFFNPYHRDPHMPMDCEVGKDYFFRFEKYMK